MSNDEFMMDPDLFIDTEDPDELFCFDFQKSRDSMGSRTISSKLPEGDVHQIEEYITTHRIPCKTISEYIRWAIRHGLKSIAKKAQSPTLTAYITAQETEFRDRYFKVQLEALENRKPIISERIKLLLSEGDAVNLRDYIMEEFKYANSQPREWRRRSVKALSKVSYMCNALTTIEDALSPEDQEFIATTLKLWRNEGLWT